MAIREDTYAVVHDLHTFPVGQNLYMTRSRHPRNAVHVPTPRRHLDALIVSERLRCELLKFSWVSYTARFQILWEVFYL
jgi:hypothetical protein